MNSMDPNLELLSAYLDGELEGEALERVEERLQTDAEFRRCYYDFRAIRESIQRLPHFKLGPEFTGNVLETIENRISERAFVATDGQGTSASNPQVNSLKAQSSKDQSSNRPPRKRKWIPWIMGAMAASILVGLTLPGLPVGPRTVTMAPIGSEEFESSDAATEDLPSRGHDAHIADQSDSDSHTQTLNSEFQGMAADRQARSADLRQLTQSLPQASQASPAPRSEPPSRDLRLDTAKDRQPQNQFRRERRAFDSVPEGLVNNTPHENESSEDDLTGIQPVNERSEQITTPLAWTYSVSDSNESSLGRSSLDIDSVDFKADSDGYNEKQLVALLGSVDLQRAALDYQGTTNEPPLELASRISTPEFPTTEAFNIRPQEDTTAPPQTVPPQKKDLKAAEADDENNFLEPSSDAAKESRLAGKQRFVIVTTTSEAAAALLQNLDALAKSRVRLTPVSERGVQVQQNFFAYANQAMNRQGDDVRLRETGNEPASKAVQPKTLDDELRLPDTQAENASLFKKSEEGLAEQAASESPPVPRKQVGQKNLTRSNMRFSPTDQDNIAASKVRPSKVGPSKIAKLKLVRILFEFPTGTN